MMERSILLPRSLIIVVVVVLLMFTTRTARAFVSQQPTRTTPIAPLLRVHQPGVLYSTTTSFDDYSPTDPDQDLAYEDTVVGTGGGGGDNGDDVVAADGMLVTVAYKGSLLSNGKVFDEGPGISFRLGDGKVIAGWEQGIAGMKVGGKRTLKIPPNLAYGDQGAGDMIPPGAHLVFDCELKAIATSPVEEIMAQLGNLPSPTILALILVLGNFILLGMPNP